MRVSDPGEMRHCMRPDCEASFNIVAAYLGEEHPGPWRQVNTLNGYLCPEHGQQCVGGGHAPGLIEHGIRCGCGWEHRSPEPSTLGQRRDEWVAHLIDATARSAA